MKKYIFIAFSVAIVCLGASIATAAHAAGSTAANLGVNLPATSDTSTVTVVNGVVSITDVKTYNDAALKAKLTAQIATLKKEDTAIQAKITSDTTTLAGL